MSLSITEKPIERPFYFLSQIEAEKVVSVALACFLMFDIQFGFSGNATMGIAFSCSVLTMVSERFLRKDQIKNSWFDILAIDFNALTIQASVSVAIQILAGILFRNVKSGYYLGLNTIFISAIIAPLSEEIFFRGFIKERLEDSLNLLCGHFSERVRKATAMVGQSVIFGAAHVRKVYSIPLIASKALFGLAADIMKDRTNSLIHPIIAHSIHNSLAIFRVCLGIVV